MVKILANGEIVPDNDPRAKQQPSAATQRHAPQQQQRQPQGLGSQPASGSGAAAGTGEENILKGDLARLVGIHGKTLQIRGRDVPLVYLLVAGALALLWVTGKQDVIRMMIVPVMFYIMYKQYQQNQAAGAAGAAAGQGGAPGQGGDDQGSGGSVYRRS
mmetsp:Transcript_47100/g.132827  ORF Transcript_47100/g.132827 Transcript_47100/m.132827 type:complete len:159 (+) Transcript_47100:105-581(+)